MRSLLRVEPLDRRENEQAERDPLFIRAAARAMRVLSAFHRARGPLTLAEIAAGAGLDRSAAQRLVHTLMQLGYLRRAPDGRGYLPGLRVLDHTLDVLRLDPMVQKATPVLLELRRTTGERVDLSLYDGVRMIYALRMQSKRETFYATLVGHSVPSFCTAGGRAALSRLPEAEVRDLLAQMPPEAYTPATRTAPEEILAAVAEARAAGHALVVEELLLGEVAIGVPIVSAEGRPLGAIHVAGSLGEWTAQDFAARHAPAAMEAGQAISTA